MKNKATVQTKNYKDVVRNSRVHKLLALKAARQAELVLPYFEKVYPKDERPRLAIEALRAWAQGKMELDMATVRKLSLDAHAAARAAKTDVARYAARAAGQAVATWHVPTHALGVPYYAGKITEAVKEEKMNSWQSAGKCLKKGARPTVKAKAIASATSTSTTCSRSHKFIKDKRHPVCPIYWPGRHAKR